MAGHPQADRPAVQAVATNGLPRRPDGKVHYMRVFAAFGADGRVHIESVGAQGSHQLAATSMANAIAEVPDGNGIEPGGTVRTLLLSIG
jgi:molybdopterin biosynthesis enzyme